MEYNNIDLLVTRSVSPVLNDEVGSNTSDIEKINQIIVSQKTNEQNIEKLNLNSNITKPNLHLRIIVSIL